jgi:hypothetical protein
MTESAHRRFRHDGHRVGLGAAVVGIAALSGAGTLAGVLPAVPTSHHRPVAVADAAVLGLPASSATGTASTTRDRTDAAVPGAAPFPRTSSSPITAIFT